MAVDRPRLVIAVVVLGYIISFVIHGMQMDPIAVFGLEPRQKAVLCYSCVLENTSSWVEGNIIDYKLLSSCLGLALKNNLFPDDIKR